MRSGSVGRKKRIGVVALLIVPLVVVGVPAMSGEALPGTPASERRVVIRTLDFTADPAEARVAHRLPFGGGQARVGWTPICVRDDCPPPCPCSTQVQPTSFDVGREGRLWVVDAAKRRVAVFREDGSFERGFRGGGLRGGSSDIQVTPARAVVVGQEDGTTYYSELLEDGRVLKQPVLYRGERVYSGSFFHQQGGRFSSVALVPRDDGQVERVQPVELAFAGTHVHAFDAPGRPYRAGWLLNDRSRVDQIVLKVQSPSEPMNVTIRFRFRQLINGEPLFVEGAVPYDLEIDDEGTFHILLKAGTFSRRPLSGYWYLTVSGAGEVGRPVRLRDPKRADDQQQRHLALDERGRPFYMRPGHKALLIEDLSDT